MKTYLLSKRITNSVKLKIVFVFAFYLVMTFSSQGQSILGKWKTIDDETGREKSIVELYKEDGKIFGKVVKLLLPEDQGKLCEKCEGAEHNKPIEGMVIVKNMELDDDNTYEDGTIFDPKKGKKYTCKMWIEDDEPNKLNVRGYIAFLYRTQYWYRVTE